MVDLGGRRPLKRQTLDTLFQVKLPAAWRDVDLLVAFDRSPSYSEFMRLKILLEDLLGARVDLVTEHGLRARVRPSVERDAILVA